MDEIDEEMRRRIPQMYFAGEVEAMIKRGQEKVMNERESKRILYKEKLPDCVWSFTNGLVDKDGFTTHWIISVPGCVDIELLKDLEAVNGISYRVRYSKIEARTFEDLEIALAYARELYS